MIPAKKLSVQLMSEMEPGLSLIPHGWRVFLCFFFFCLGRAEIVYGRGCRLKRVPGGTAFACR